MSDIKGKLCFKIHKSKSLYSTAENLFSEVWFFLNGTLALIFVGTFVIRWFLDEDPAEKKLARRCWCCSDPQNLLSVPTSFGLSLEKDCQDINRPKSAYQGSTGYGLRQWWSCFCNHDKCTTWMLRCLFLQALEWQKYWCDCLTLTAGTRVVCCV